MPTLNGVALSDFFSAVIAIKIQVLGSGYCICELF